MRRAEDAPALSPADVSERISAIAEHEEFLFYRVLGGTDGYEMFCTACGSRFFEERDRKNPAKNYSKCPKCGARISPKRWRNRARVDAIQFAFHTWTRGEGSDIWLRSYQVRMQREFEDDDKYDVWEYCRICFHEGGAKKWTRSRNWMFGVTDWQPVKKIGLKRWHGAYGMTRKDCWDQIELDDLRGSCLQYAPEEAIYHLDDPVEFFALFLKYPAVEYVWKMGFDNLFRARERGVKADFNRVVNLRAKKPDKLFRGLDKADLRALKNSNCIGILQMREYKRLKQAGVSQNRSQLADWAVKVSNVEDSFWRLAERIGTDAKTMLKYLDRQARRRRVEFRDAFLELQDYNRQLNALGVDGGDRMPHDLHEAHERLSERERIIVHREQNQPFRIRRRLLRWMCWRHNGMFIRPVDSPAELIKEGEQQHNCVAGYARRHAEGQTIILLLRKCSAPCESWHTVEINPETLVCKQCYQAHNMPRTPEAAAFMVAYLEHLQQVRPGRKKTKRSAA